MNKLDEIIAAKRLEVEENKSLYPVKLLEKSIFSQADPVSLTEYVLRKDLYGIIAEFKRRSPSRGLINEFADSAKIPLRYMQAGASALSVITDKNFFWGSNNDLILARQNNYCPILRKDFIVDEYQVYESRSIGADAILLIASVLTKNELKVLHDMATSLGMEVLVEVHDTAELDKLPGNVQLVGVNSRNLKNFEVNTRHAIDMAEKLPGQVVKIAESGIDSPETLISLRQAGYHGFLMGERFMREADPGKACRRFIKQLNGSLNKNNESYAQGNPTN